MKLLIYLPKLTSRNRYAIKTVLKSYLKFVDFEFTTDLEKYGEYKDPKFSYAPKSIEGVHFTAMGLLEQRGINEQSVSLGEFQDGPTLFSHKRPSALPFDPFAAIFFMISRYEEYLPHLRDKYDRFTSKDCIAKQHNFLHIAVVDRWAMAVAEVLQSNFPELRFGQRKFEYISTIDIDNAYAYKEKGFLRSLGSMMKFMYKLDFVQLSMQLQVLARRRKDPFDTYNYQLNIQKKYGCQPIYFILIGDYGFNDKNLSHENKRFQSLIKSLADYAKVGIHPSFGSNQKGEKLHNEIERLERIVKREIKRSRQHFLKLRLPATYRNLIEEDITEDYTMGFAEELGFRAGTCTPYPFYDLDGEVECKLQIYPFQVMEASLKYYLKLDAESSIDAIKKIIDEVKSVKGTFISLWHNESLSDELEWKGWRRVFEKMIQHTQ